MDTENLPEAFKEDFPLLIEAGFVAVKQLDEMSATRIFHAAQAMSPSSTAPQIGLGFIALNKLDMKNATKIFDDVTKKEPENHLAQTFLGMCYLMNKPKRKQGQQLIAETMEKTADPTIKSLGKIALEWAERDLNKVSSPFFPGKDDDENLTKKEKEPLFAKPAEGKKGKGLK